MHRFVLFISLISIVALSCSERVFMEEEGIVPLFSEDTIRFDTVFTVAGSTTKELRVVNPYNRWVKIDRIFLEGEGESSFRINVDGMPGGAENINIAPGDSIFIFIDLMADPSGEDIPVFLTDSVIFDVAGTISQVILEAWGQDIHLISDEIVKTSLWGAGKPWVIWNSMVVDTGEVLTVEAGARLLFHRGATMFVAGTLIVNGEYDNKVIFSSDRTEAAYNDVPGQWNGIVFLNGSSSNYIDNTVIKNGTSAIQLGNLFSEEAPPDLSITNTIIRHMTVGGISSLGGTVTAANCDIGHCGFYALYFAMGGSYSVTHCTIANLWEYSTRVTPSVLISDYYDYDGTRFTGTLEGAAFANSVVAGTLRSEILILPSGSETELPCSFIDSWLDIDNTDPLWLQYELTGVVTGDDPIFVDFTGYDFRPDSLSPLIDAAGTDAALLWPTDIRGLDRLSDSRPDIGAYERQPGENDEKSK
ncbi:MAG: right-handed parallel beta-helix repeat-containing protein [Bacteroidales bacterium]|nr:right-handed parallel beta-helix repeat-containing protein [Bacteroidales bacterium]